MYTVDGFTQFCAKVLHLNTYAAAEGHCEHPRFGPPTSITQLAATALRTGSSQYLHIFKSVFPHHIITQFATDLSHTLFNAILQLLNLAEVAKEFPGLQQRLYDNLRRSEATGGAGFTMPIDILDAAPLTSRSQCAGATKTICQYKHLTETGPHMVFELHTTRYNNKLAAAKSISTTARHKHKMEATASGHEPVPNPQCAIKDYNVKDKELGPYLKLFETSGLYRDGNTGKMQKIQQGKLTAQLWWHNMMAEYYDPLASDSPSDQQSIAQYYKRYNGSWGTTHILTHLRTVTSVATAANGSALWRLCARIRDPFTYRVNNYRIDNLQFLIATRIQLGLGMEGVLHIPPQASPYCSECPRSRLMDQFHVIHGCAAHRASINKRHNEIQQVYIDLAEKTGATIFSNAPNVTPTQGPNEPEHSAFADFSVSHNGMAIIFDPTLFSPFKSSARTDAQQATVHGERPSKGQPAQFIAATGRRRKKYIEKRAGATERGCPFSPIVHTQNDAFIPQDPKLLRAHQNMIEQVANQSSFGKHGSRPISYEEHIIRKWSRAATDTKSGGMGLYDTTLSLDRAAGLVTAHTFRQLAFNAIKHTTNAVVDSIRANNLLCNSTQPTSYFDLSYINLPDTESRPPTPSSQQSRCSTPISIGSFISASSSSTECMTIDSDFTV